MSIPVKKLQYLEFPGFSTQNSGRLLRVKRLKTENFRKGRVILFGGVADDCAIRQRLLKFGNLSLGEVGVVLEKQQL